MTRLSGATLDLAAPEVRRPAYDRTTVTPGIVHFGPSAFHRAHQAAYVDTILADDPRWGISAVALTSTATADALRPQDGLYTLALLGTATDYRVIGSLVELLTAHDAAAIDRRLADPATRLVTATVTEKGYCLTAGGGLDFAHPGIVADLAGGVPTTLVGWLAHGLARRRAAGLDGLTLLSCDNLAANGRRLHRAVTEFADARDAALAAWIGETCRFPSSMVDSITPATDEPLRARVAAATGLDDTWPIQREPFSQWVIEDAFAGERPPLDQAGVQFATDVAPFEEAKLRLLNGAHSSLAYLGLLLGHETVGEAMADPALARTVERMMREDIALTLRPAAGLDVSAYIGAVLARFRNPAIRHLLTQIAWDGSQKLPFRLLGTIGEALAAGRPIERLALPIAAWIRFLATMHREGRTITDPLADVLAPLAAAGEIDTLLGVGAIFPSALAGNNRFRAALHAAHAGMANRNELRALLN